MEFCKSIEGVEWKETGVEEGWEELEAVMKRAVRMKNKGKEKRLGWIPWWYRECKEKKREAVRARRKYRRSQGDGGYEEFLISRREHRKICEKKEVEHKKRRKRDRKNKNRRESVGVY